jgi:hypothetical protein
MEWKTVQKDFIIRSLELLSQYDDYVARVVPLPDRFEVTLLVNCLTGLLVFPFEYAYRGVNRDDRKTTPMFKEDTTALKDLSPKWGLSGLDLYLICDFDHRKIEPPENACLRILIYRLRNSIAHTRFEDAKNSNLGGLSFDYQPHPGNPNESQIEKVVFRDQKPTGKKEEMFKATIGVSDLRTFSERLARTVLGV